MSTASVAERSLPPVATGAAAVLLSRLERPIDVSQRKKQGVLHIIISFTYCVCVIRNEKKKTNT